MSGSGTVIGFENVGQLTELSRWGRGVIKDIDLSVNGQWVAVASGSGVYIHNVYDLDAKPQAIETEGNVSAVSISPSGDKVALVTWGNEFQVWQLEPLTQLFETGNVEKVQFSPDGSILAINKIVVQHNTKVQSLELWDSNDGTVLATFQPDNQFNPRIKFSPDGSLIAVWSQSGSTVSVYDWEENRLILEKEATVHPEQEGEYQAITGDVVFTTENDLRLLVLEGEYFIRLSGKVEVQELETSEVLFTVGEIGYLTDATKYVCNEPVIFFDPPELPVPYHMEIASEAQIVALRYEDVGYVGDFGEYSSLRFFQTATGQQLYKIDEGIVDFELAPDGQTWIAGLQDGRLQVRRLSDGAVLESVDAYESPILKIISSPDSERVGVVYVDEVKIYDRKDGTVLYRYQASNVAFAPDGQSFALGYQDGRIELRNIVDGSSINSIVAHQDRVTAISYLPSGELLSAGFDCKLNLRQVPSMTSIGALENVMVEGEFSGEQVPVRVRDLIVRSDGLSVIGVFYGGDFGVWTLPDGHLARTPGLAYEDATNVYAVATDDGILAVPLQHIPEVWDTAITFIETDASPAAFSPDSQMLAGEQWEYGQDISLDGALKVWRVSPMRLLHVVTPQTNAMTAVTFTADGQFILSGALDGIIRLWGTP